jgi:hypothetical protein
MGRFITPRRFFSIRFSGDVLELQNALVWETWSKAHVVVPPNFKTDLASVPQVLKSLAPSWEETARAGVLHDFAYRIDSTPSFSRQSADETFYEALRAEGVGAFRAWAMYAAVRMFGGGSYHKQNVQ